MEVQQILDLPKQQHQGAEEKDHKIFSGHPLSGPDPTSAAKKEVKHRFEITKKLGSGTYGKVSLAFDHKFERETLSP
ncbi:unnamed protein product [Strongylus vulgaris]|uniref:Protein kinase domain-containing protein n=1 Tax=Strongylus vulgaris TaxID=40348 RepID=A0A3P7L8E8_STRVU|nr:unnamed protein product [Strongylus vulgaris]